MADEEVGVSVFEAMRPERSYDRLAFISPDVAPSRVVPFPGDLERVFQCVGCRRSIAVGPSWEDIDPDAYLGIVCGCFERLGGVVHTLAADTTSATDVASGTAGNSREASV